MVVTYHDADLKESLKGHCFVYTTCMFGQCNFKNSTLIFKALNLFTDGSLLSLLVLLKVNIKMAVQ